MDYKNKWQSVTRRINVSMHDGYRTIYPRHIIGQRKRFSRKSSAPGYSGQTAFYRNPNAQHAIINWTKNKTGKRRILILPGSIGCEAYTFAMIAANEGLSQNELEIHSLDISDEFTRVAKSGIYPAQALLGLPQSLTQYFSECSNEDFVAVRDEIKERVTFLPHSSLKRFKTPQAYDGVVCQNLLKHIYNNIWLNLQSFSRVHKDKNKDPLRHARQSPQLHAINKLCDLTKDVLFVDMIEETPFYFGHGTAPFNPFAERGMAYLDEDLKPFGNGADYPSEYKDIDRCLQSRGGVHAFQQPQI